MPLYKIRVVTEQYILAWATESPSEKDARRWMAEARRDGGVTTERDEMEMNATADIPPAWKGAYVYTDEDIDLTVEEAVRRG